MIKICMYICFQYAFQYAYTNLCLLHILYLDIEYNIKFQTILRPRTVLPLCKKYSKDQRLCVVCKSFAYQTRHMRIQRGGGTGGSDPPPPWNCQIISFYHVEIFRQTPSGNLDPLRKFSGSAHAPISNGEKSYSLSSFC